MSGPSARTDWLYASGAISREDWRRLRPSDPVGVLWARYARQEISREEFLKILGDLTGPVGALA